MCSPGKTITIAVFISEWYQDTIFFAWQKSACTVEKDVAKTCKKSDNAKSEVQDNNTHSRVNECVRPIIKAPHAYVTSCKSFCSDIFLGIF